MVYYFSLVHFNISVMFHRLIPEEYVGGKICFYGNTKVKVRFTIGLHGLAQEFYNMVITNHLGMILHFLLHQQENVRVIILDGWDCCVVCEPKNESIWLARNQD